jgi:hypothetical protein
MQPQCNNLERNKELAYLGVRDHVILRKLHGERNFLIIEGAKIKTEAGESFLIKSGYLVEFPEGLSCKWQIIKSFKKNF